MEGVAALTADQVGSGLIFDLEWRLALRALALGQTAVIALYSFCSTFRHAQS